MIGVEWGPGGGQARSVQKPQAGPPGHVRRWRPRAILSSQRFELGGVTALPGVSATLLRGGGLPRGEGWVGGPHPAVPVSVQPVCMPPRGSLPCLPRSPREQNQQPPPAARPAVSWVREAPRPCTRLHRVHIPSERIASVKWQLLPPVTRLHMDTRVTLHAWRSVPPSRGTAAASDPHTTRQDGEGG